jgi:hypothetical protein
MEAKFVTCECREYGPKPTIEDEVLFQALWELLKKCEKGSRTRSTLLGQAVGRWEEFRRGFNEELEHGCRSPETNITCDDPLATAKIVLAHLNEEPDYYTRHNLGEPVDEPTVRDVKDEIHETYVKGGGYVHGDPIR